MVSIHAVQKASMTGMIVLVGFLMGCGKTDLAQNSTEKSNSTSIRKTNSNEKATSNDSSAKPKNRLVEDESRTGQDMPVGSYIIDGPDVYELRIRLLPFQSESDRVRFDFLPYRNVPSLANKNLKYA